MKRILMLLTVVALGASALSACGDPEPDNGGQIDSEAALHTSRLALQGRFRRSDGLNLYLASTAGISSSWRYCS